MKKQNYLKFVILITFLVFIVACEKPNIISDPITVSSHSIIIENTPPLIINEELVFHLEEFAERKNTRVSPKSIEWVIKDSDWNIYSTESTGNNTIKWIPEKAGSYIVWVRHWYDDAVIFEESKEIVVVDDTRDPYLGEYHFMNIYYSWAMGVQSEKDTTYFDGFVQADPDNKKNIIIKCKDKPFNSWYYFSTELKFNEEAIHPVFVINEDLRYYHGGQFVDYNKLFIEAVANGLGGGGAMNSFGTKK